MLRYKRLFCFDMFQSLKYVPYGPKWHIIKQIYMHMCILFQIMVKTLKWLHSHIPQKTYMHVSKETK